MGKRIVHVEFPAKDADRAESFWEGLGGWSIADSGMPGIDYRMLVRTAPLVFDTRGVTAGMDAPNVIRL